MLSPVLILLLLLCDVAFAAVRHIVHVSIFRLPLLVLAGKFGVKEYVIHQVGYALIALYLWYRWDAQRRKEKKMGVPVLHGTPQGWSLPWIGHALTFWLRSPWDLLMEWHRQSDWAPAISFPLSGRYVFSVASPSLLKTVLQTKIQHTAEDLKHSLQPFLAILGTGMMSSHGKTWMDQRKQMSHPICVDVLQYIPVHTVAAVRRLMDTLDMASASDGARTTTIPMSHELRELTLQVILSSFLSLGAKEGAETFAELYLPIVEEANRRVRYPYRSYLFILPAFWQYHWNVYRLNLYVSQLIRARWEQRKQHGGPHKNHDALDHMLEDIPRLTGARIRQFRDEIKTFVLAGHETSVAAMTWTLYELMANPKLAEQVRKEAVAVLGNRGVDDVPGDVSQLVLTEACLKESLRKYSVVPISTRVVTKAFEADGVWFPKGSTIAINIQSVHLNPEFWPNPMKYDPQRFLQKQEPAPFTFLPFNAGPHNCLGQNLSLLESKMVIAMLMQRYEFKLPGLEGVNTESWEGQDDPRHRLIVPIVPKEELAVQVKKR